tara:strand:- start:376 stop:1077 length:702 start_codon:yes stop_codon:yes gene_type:complete
MGHYSKYIFEFIVIISGITLSFAIDDYRENNYKRNLTEKSLIKIKKSIEKSLKRNKTIIKASKDAVNIADILINRNLELFNNKKDSLGYYLSLFAVIETRYHPNEEEYIAMRNSGLIELIENDSLVDNLQKRYSSLDFMEAYNVGIWWEEVRRIAYSKLSFQKKDSGLCGFNSFGEPRCPVSEYIYYEPLNDEELNIISRKKRYLMSHHDLTIERSILDNIIIKQITKEINSS